MTPSEITRKLSLIARLSREEIEGWRKAMRMFRAPFDGEQAALSAREKQLTQEGR